MRVLNAVQRIIMLLLLIPVVVICLNALLRALNARESNPIVSAVRGARDKFVLPMFKTVFAGKNPLQDELVTLAAIAVLALAVIFLFRGLRSLAGTKPPKRVAPAPKPSRAAEKPAAKPAPEAEATQTTGASQTSGESRTTGATPAAGETSPKQDEASVPSAGTSSDGDTHSSST